MGLKLVSTWDNEGIMHAGMSISSKGSNRVIGEEFQEQMAA
jgi:hypothetical protein